MGVKIKQKGKDASFFSPFSNASWLLDEDVPRTSHSLKVIIENTDT